MTVSFSQFYTKPNYYTFSKYIIMIFAFVLCLLLLLFSSFNGPPLAHARTPPTSVLTLCRHDRLSDKFHQHHWSISAGVYWVAGSSLRASQAPNPSISTTLNEAGVVIPISSVTETQPKSHNS